MDKKIFRILQMNKKIFRILQIDKKIFRILQLDKKYSEFYSLKFCVSSCTDQESYVRGSPTLTFYLVDEGKEFPNTTLSEQSSARQ